MVYFWKDEKNGVVYHHTSLEAAAQIDGLTKAPDWSVEDAIFEAAECIIRLVDGKIVLGKTAAEKQAQENERRITVLKQNLKDTDYISAKIAEGSATVKEYEEQIVQRQAWRQEINRLTA